MRRRIVGVLISLLIAASIAGCGVEKEPLMYQGRMKYAGISVDRGFRSGYIWIDTETGVCYMESFNGVFTVMVDREGKPFIANGWRDWSDGDELY